MRVECRTSQIDLKLSLIYGGFTSTISELENKAFMCNDMFLFMLHFQRILI